MPKTQRQRRGEIVRDLRRFGKTTIPQADFDRVLENHDVTNPGAIKDYIRKLEEGNYLTRVKGGFRLTNESMKAGTITIRVTPSQHTASVAAGLTAALHQFGPLATMELVG